MGYSRHPAYPFATWSHDELPVILRSAFLPAALALMLASTAAPAQALDPRVRDHDVARMAAERGEIRSLGEIRDRVGARVRGELVGSELDMRARRYRLRYLRDGAVVEVDVDARTGKIVGIEGN
jgi:uncharacterized membrane protein YkoI